ncbi:unnamed protein product [Blepharisma stoltei]|uniref:Right handed beta helix domain-containing protein n=1 Tax=Blepharisma stoltei TaxID=1481888 RepID=A0AAU9IEN1_9CILI|nr:unnamed protein product [Blepharisma stoltei]
MSLSPNRHKRTETNIEKKILRTTFITHENNLQALNSGQAKASPSNSQLWQSNSSDSFSSSQYLSPHISAIKGMENFWFAIQQEESSESISNEISEFPSYYDIILNANPGDTINLPAEKIIMKEILIAKPITIKGTAGSVLEIQNGSITIDFGQNHYSQSRATLCEINIIYTVTPAKIEQTETKQPFGLFIINGNNTTLEVRDCQIKSNNSIRESNEFWIEIEDVCFWVNGNGYKKKYSPELVRFKSILYVKSCNISHFHEALIGGVNSSVVIEKSHISNIRGSGVKMINPRELNIHQAKFTKCAGYGVDLRIVPFAHGHSGQSSHSTSTDSFLIQQMRSISIHMTTFKSCGDNSIHIWGEIAVNFPGRITVTQCKITNCKREGLSVQHICVSDLQIIDNEFKENQKTGIWIQKVRKTDKESLIILNGNISAGSSAGYGVYFYDTSITMNKCECSGNALGGAMIVARKDFDGKSIEFKECRIFKNEKNGVSIFEFYRGKIKMKDTQVFENSMSGICVFPEVKLEILQAELYLKRCYVGRNKQFGVMAYQVACNLVGTIMEENTIGPLLIDKNVKKPAKRKREKLAHKIPERKVCKGNCGIL